MWLYEWLAFGLCLGALGLALGPRAHRRKHFWLRLVAVPLVPGLALAITTAVIPTSRMQTVTRSLCLLAVPALLLAPALLYRPSGPPPGPSADEGGGPGPEPPPPAPTRPGGGIPLLDAHQALARVRDHNRPRLAARRLRRPGREPAREPVRVRAG